MAMEGKTERSMRVKEHHESITGPGSEPDDGEELDVADAPG